MNALQRFFNRLVGVIRYETELRDQAHKLYCASSLDLAVLERPACWRRTARHNSTAHQ